MKSKPKYCGCGCGNITKLVNRKYNKFIKFHSSRKEHNANWKGGKSLGIDYNKNFSKEYYQANKEIRKLKDKKYYVDNREKVLVKAKEYREKNRLKINGKTKEYYRKNRDILIQKVKEYRNKNTEKISQRRKKQWQEYRKAHPLKGRPKGKRHFKYIDLEPKKEQIINLYKQGFYCTDIAKKYDVSSSSIAKRLESWRIKVRRHQGYRYDLDNYKIEIINLYNNGLDARKIAKKYKTCLASILRRLNKWNIKIRKNTDYDVTKRKNYRRDIDKKKEKIIKSYEKGYDSIRLGREYNIDPFLIRKRLRNWGVKIRKSTLSCGTTRKFKADDGHTLSSSTEMFIDNFLFHNGIEHIVHKRIGFGNCECDFYIVDCNLYVEYWGLMGKKDYMEKRERKLGAYRRLGLNLLSLYPTDNLPEKLRFLLNYSRIQKRVTDFEVPKGICIITKEDET